jgi:hypothetical protein
LSHARDDTINVPPLSSVDTNLGALMIKRVIVAYGMKWMQVRLRVLGKSGAALGRHLGIPKERVYEMFAGKRRLQQEEIGPTARFLEWSEAELIAHLEGRVLNETNKQIGNIAMQQVAALPQPFSDSNLPPLVLYKSAQTLDTGRGEFMLLAQRTDEVPRPFFLKFSTKAFAVRVLNDRMEPAYRRWDTLIIDPDSPAIDGEDCLFTDNPEAPGGGLSVIANLKASTDGHWSVHQYGTKQDFELPKSEFPQAWPIVGRYNRR